MTPGPATNEYKRQRYAALVAQGKCPRCRTAVQGRKHCDECRLDLRASSAKYYAAKRKGEA